MEQEVKAEFDGFIGIFEDAFDKQYIKEIISFFEKSSDLPLVQKPKELKHSVDQDAIFFSNPDTIQIVPNYYTSYFFQVLWDKIIPLYTDQFSILSQTQLAGEELKMKRIKPGGGFHTWHYEGLGEYSKRKLVCQLYLNDIPKAGETEFLYQNKRIEPKEGRLLVFPADWTHTHRGNPPIGVINKYIITTWLFEAPK
tara:strand:+ start:1199 stop:1789 length:591 start_codon:yes stop_codon:yes gene_type:complete